MKIEDYGDEKDISFQEKPIPLLILDFGLNRLPTRFI
jgi:hypothetical protein